MAYEFLDERQFRRVYAEPDDDPVTEWPWAPSTYAYWITPELIKEVTG